MIQNLRLAIRLFKLQTSKNNAFYSPIVTTNYQHPAFKVKDSLPIFSYVTATSMIFMAFLLMKKKGYIFTLS